MDSTMEHRGNPEQIRRRAASGRPVSLNALWERRLQTAICVLIRKPRPLQFLGPCVGEVTPRSAKLWIHTPRIGNDSPIPIAFSLHAGSPDAPAIQRREVLLTSRTLGAGTVTFTELEPDTRYFYRVWLNRDTALSFDGIEPDELYFRTFPADEELGSLNFLLMSCHDPTQCEDDGADGFAIWSALDQIRDTNDVRFALLAGDQVYGDHIQEKLLAEKSPLKRIQLYLGLYQKLWSHPIYRRTLCSLPSYLMWDDHDITDGWGSRSDLFKDATSSEFQKEWKGLFESARECFRHLQASRNPAPLREGPDAAFDFCFKLGSTGFVVTDLRSNRNVRKHQIWSQDQFEAVTGWINANKADLDALFLVSPVVFTHGWPHIEKAIRSFAPLTTALTQALNHVPGLRQLRSAERLITRYIQDVAGYRDDLEDAWASDPNNAQAEQLLDYLFSLQNPKDGSDCLPVIILSGDIHAAGYSMIYSYKPEHSDRPVIEHICSSPVASKPMHWFVESMYMNQVKTVPIGTSGKYFGQVSHHHSHRNVAVLSIRRVAQGEMQLKAKFYLEGRPQPEILVSDLKRVSHAERVDWDLKRCRPKQGRSAA